MGIVKKQPAIFLGLVITILFLGLSLSNIEFFETLELKFYDIRMSLKNISDNSEDIVIVDIDDDSIKNIGRWPWSRSVIAQCIDKINTANPKIIGMNIMYNEPENSSGLEQIKGLIKMVEQSEKQDSSLLRTMKAALNELDNDRKLKESLEKAGNVIFPVNFYSSRISEKIKQRKTRNSLKDH
ncbi:CHASE2 domain-containing protein [Desulfonema limicola]|uniref:CHASE2 domain-containing protein n=1 Tax=Desulfonema limicola TaxID=45656 RepID=UPI001A9B7770|nr:CHASE2 domain-containing protein [Desulfonema limicola]